jgi:uncharacterized SAM-binding protein YcdF (DUF218 family)
MVLLMHYAAWCLFPLSLCLELLLVGLAFLWFGKRKTVGKVLVTLATTLLLLFSSGPFARLLVRPLEAAYPPLLDPEGLDSGSEGPVKWVVVLGAGYNPDPDMPATARPTSTSLARLAEGVRIHRRLPASKLLVLVGEGGDGDLRRLTVTELAGAFGVGTADLVVEEGARDTAEEVRVIAATVRDERFVLVTSASHLPRAVRQSHEMGLHAIPAPTDYRAGRREYAGLHDLPSPANLEVSQVGLYEALASLARLVRR